MAYKEGVCCKCDMPIVVQTHDWSELNSYCITCANDKLMYVPKDYPKGDDQ